MINRTGLTAIFITTKSDRNLANRYVHWLGNSMFKLVDGVSQTLLLINCILQIKSLKRSHTIAEKKLKQITYYHKKAQKNAYYYKKAQTVY
jgi:hypothetical protein